MAFDKTWALYLFLFILLSLFSLDVGVTLFYFRELLPCFCGKWSEGAQNYINPMVHSFRAREKAFSWCSYIRGNAAWPELGYVITLELDTSK